MLTEILLTFYELISCSDAENGQIMRKFSM
jgi:hypothetical protein